MGADIHIVLQVRSGESTWEKIATPERMIWRNYSLFGFLADVRNRSQIVPVDMPRGLPPDIKAEVVDEMWRGVWLGDHSFGWLYLSEIVRSAAARPDDTIGFRPFIAACVDLLKQHGEVRMVFGFDS